MVAVRLAGLDRDEGPVVLLVWADVAGRSRDHTVDPAVSDVLSAARPAFTAAYRSLNATQHK